MTADQARARPEAPVDLATPGRFHVVGVAGPGMNPIATVLAQMGHRVSGSDRHDGEIVARLRRDGVAVTIGHDPALIQGVDAVTASTAIPADNVELVAARAAGVLTLRRAGMLASICARADTVAVAGTHGKTTTTSMLAAVLDGAGLDPSLVVGGDVHQLGTGARWTGGRHLVVEADESDGTFLELPLYGTILTNVETDHLDHFGTFDAIVAGFDAYLGQIPGPKVVCIDGPHAAALAERHHAIAYGLSTAARWRPVDITPRPGGQRFVVELDGRRVADVDLPLRGVHNVLNAVAAMAMGEALGVPPEVASSALGAFGGVRRRFDVRVVRDGITLVDDYAHLPSEIAAVLAGVRAGADGWARVVAVFQPNRFKRMAVMSPDYADAFVDADLAVVTEIYPSGEATIPGVTGRWVVDAVVARHPEAHVEWIAERDELVAYLARELRPGDVCISMGCGDVERLPDEVASVWPPGAGAR